MLHNRDMSCLSTFIYVCMYIVAHIYFIFVLEDLCRFGINDASQKWSLDLDGMTS